MKYPDRRYAKLCCGQHHHETIEEALHCTQVEDPLACGGCLAAPNRGPWVDTVKHLAAAGLTALRRSNACSVLIMLDMSMSVFNPLPKEVEVLWEAKTVLALEIGRLGRNDPANVTLDDEGYARVKAALEQATREPLTGQEEREKQRGDAPCLAHAIWGKCEDVEALTWAFGDWTWTGSLYSAERIELLKLQQRKGEK